MRISTVLRTTIAFLVGLICTFSTESVSVSAQPIDANSAATGRQDQEKSDTQWITELEKIPARSRWDVGAGVGGELAQLPGDRALKILKKCWKDIAPDVRQQMLKGLQPSFGFTSEISDRHFQIMNLGMTAKNAGVRQFANAYLKGMVLQNIDDEKSYKKWYGKVRSLNSTEVFEFEAKRFAKSLDDENVDVNEAIKQLQESMESIKTNSAFKDALVEAGVKQKLDAWLDSKTIAMSDNGVAGVVKLLSPIVAPPAKRIAGAKTVGDNARKSYFQYGPKSDVKQPANGWKVLVILPGGDGSEDFQGYCKNIHKNALPDDYVAIQLVAPTWTEDENRVVWPTKKLNPDKAKFTTEDFIREAVEDVGKNLKLDASKIFALGWSSSGPPVYATSVTDGSPVTGSFVAMSVFHPNKMNDLANAKGHPYFLLHSPGDWIKIDQHPRVAEKQLREKGAKVKLQTYKGGHGWTEDPFGNIRRGVEWLEANVINDE